MMRFLDCQVQIFPVRDAYLVEIQQFIECRGVGPAAVTFEVVEGGFADSGEGHYLSLGETRTFAQLSQAFSAELVVHRP
jgi:hypothetical protein